MRYVLLPQLLALGLFAAVVSQAHAQIPTDAPLDPRFGNGVPRTGLIANVDLLIWRTNRSGLDYAVDDGGQGHGALGFFAEPRPKFDTGFRLALGSVTSSGWDFFVRYTHFGQNAGSSFTAPTNQGAATRLHPDDFNGLVEVVDSARAVYDVDLDQFDVEIGYWFDVSDSAALRPFAGVRCLRLDQSMYAFYADTSTGDFSDVLQTQRANAGGIVVGGEARWTVFRPALTLFGRAAVGAMVSNFENRNVETALDDNSVNVDTTSRTRQAFLTLEAQLGLNVRLFSSSRGAVNFEAGYELYQFAGLPDFTQFVDDVADGTPGRGSASLGFDGMFARLVVTY